MATTSSRTCPCQLQPDCSLQKVLPRISPLPSYSSLSSGDALTAEHTNLMDEMMFFLDPSMSRRERRSAAGLIKVCGSGGARTLG